MRWLLHSCHGPIQPLVLCVLTNPVIVSYGWAAGTLNFWADDWLNLFDFFFFSDWHDPSFLYRWWLVGYHGPMSFLSLLFAAVRVCDFTWFPKGYPVTLCRALLLCVIWTFSSNTTLLDRTVYLIVVSGSLSQLQCFSFQRPGVCFWRGRKRPILFNSLRTTQDTTAYYSSCDPFCPFYLTTNLLFSFPTSTGAIVQSTDFFFLFSWPVAQIQLNLLWSLLLQLLPLKVCVCYQVLSPFSCLLVLRMDALDKKKNSVCVLICHVPLPL